MQFILKSRILERDDDDDDDYYGQAGLAHMCEENHYYGSYFVNVLLPNPHCLLLLLPLLHLAKFKFKFSEAPTQHSLHHSSLHRGKLYAFTLDYYSLQSRLWGCCFSCALNSTSQLLSPLSILFFKACT